MNVIKLMVRSILRNKKSVIAMIASAILGMSISGAITWIIMFNLFGGSYIISIIVSSFIGITGGLVATLIASSITNEIWSWNN